LSPLDALLLVLAFALILVGAELFTNGVEWLGQLLGLTEGATGSILAAIGTATPETLVPIVAILFTQSVEADDIGVGAILGAPFMLGTLVMLLIGVTAYAFRGRRGRDTLHVDRAHASRDLGFFLVMYALAVAVALIGPLRDLKGVIGWIFLPTYFVYLYVVLRTPAVSASDVEEEKEEQEAFDALSFARYLKRVGLAALDPHKPPAWLIVGQTLLAFGGILLGAKIFAAWIDAFSHAMGFNALLVALLLAPLATELPEAANSLIWTKDGKDVIALGNVAGAMVFQSTFPVTIGVLLTPWVLGPYGTVAALFALASGAVIWVQLRFRTRDDALPLSALIVGGSLYVIFIVYVVRSVLLG
jgi:cation:H+ antiporter